MKWVRGDHLVCVNFSPTVSGLVPEALRGQVLEVESVWPGGRHFGHVKFRGWFGYFHPDRFERAASNWRPK